MRLKRYLRRINNNRGTTIVELLSDQIARDIMTLGDEPNSPAKRIHFLAGKYPDNEINQGGLCEEALAQVINRSIRKMIDKDK